MEGDIFNMLFRVLEDRKQASPDTSYVARLMARGTEKINSKIIEESGEVCEAALAGDREHLVYEICDLLFHTFVLASYKGITVKDIRKELERRFGTSGLEEKAGRAKK